MQWPAVTYVSDVKDAVHMAKEAAGDKDVLVHGAVTAQLALTAEALDELHFLWFRCCSGRATGCSRTCRRSTSSWKLTRAFGAPGVQHLRYRVRQAG